SKSGIGSGAHAARYACNDGACGLPVAVIIADKTEAARNGSGMPSANAPGMAELRLVRAFVDAFKEEGAQVALARVRQHSEDDRTFRRVLRYFKRRGESGARGHAAEDAFLLRQRLRVIARDDVLDRDVAVVDVAVQHAADEVRRPALDLVRRPFLAGEQG